MSAVRASRFGRGPLIRRGIGAGRIPRPPARRDHGSYSSSTSAEPSSMYPSNTAPTGGFAGASTSIQGRGAPSGTTSTQGSTPAPSVQVLRDELRHLEHADLVLAVEDRAELVVRVDHPLVVRVLQPLGLDVIPHLLDDLGT